MAFFKTKPNLPDEEKARVEFNFQQIAECIGFDRFKLPVMSMESLRELSQSNRNPRELAGFVGKHLDHDVSEINLDVVPEELEKCGGGG